MQLPESKFCWLTLFQDWLHVLKTACKPGGFANLCLTVASFCFAIAGTRAIFASESTTVPAICLAVGLTFARFASEIGLANSLAGMERNGKHLGLHLTLYVMFWLATASFAGLGVYAHVLDLAVANSKNAEANSGKWRLMAPVLARQEADLEAALSGAIQERTTSANNEQDPNARKQFSNQAGEYRKLRERLLKLTIPPLPAGQIDQTINELANGLDSIRLASGPQVQAQVHMLELPQPPIAGAESPASRFIGQLRSRDSAAAVSLFVALMIELLALMALCTTVEGFSFKALWWRGVDASQGFKTRARAETIHVFQQTGAVEIEVAAFEVSGELPREEWEKIFALIEKKCYGHMVIMNANDKPINREKPILPQLEGEFSLHAVAISEIPSDLRQTASPTNPRGTA